MNTTASVVIGATFGDEGKGVLTDFLSSDYGPDCLVVRFNGGAQAGHTVTSPTGQRHVFSHLGAGTLNGSPTFLSRYFVVNPLLYSKERDSLKRNFPSVKPVILADGNCPVTTPYDMAVNQLVENSRGTSRHGSCGVGFGETLQRSLDPRYSLTLADLGDRNRLVSVLNRIKDEYFPGRLAQLGLRLEGTPFRTWLTEMGVAEGFADDAASLLEDIELAGPSVMSLSGHVIFEGAQGLLLDECHPWFPHVTRSRTGLPNVKRLAREAGLNHLNVFYVARSYLTRHGAGPLPFELPGKPYSRVEDKTNVPNAFQGALRFGWANADLLSETIQRDLDESGRPGVSANLVLTCLEQTDGSTMSYVESGVVRSGSAESLAACVCERTQLRPSMFCYGPTRETVVRL